MNRLFGMRTYLVGAMDRVADGGFVWRERLTSFLNTLGIVVFNPCNKPLKDNDSLAFETAEAREVRNKAKQRGDLKTAANCMKPIRATDLRMVDISDFLIANIDMEVHACGTYEEIFTANRQRKPILIHVEGGKANTPDWLLSVIGEKAVDDMIFNDWDELKRYLITVNEASDSIINSLNKHKRWVFFDLEKITADAMRRGHFWNKVK